MKVWSLNTMISSRFRTSNTAVVLIEITTIQKLQECFLRSLMQVIEADYICNFNSKEQLIGYF